jgi:hypothetical protein
MSELNSFQIELRRELKKIYARALGIRIGSGLVSFFITFACAGFIAAAWLAGTDQPALWQALVVSRGMLLLGIALFGLFVAAPIVRMPRFSRFALDVESRKDFKHIVAAGYEFSERGDITDRYSPDLVREVVRRAAQSLAGLPVRFLFLTRVQLLQAPLACAVLCALIIIALVSPNTLFETAQVIVSPRSAVAVSHRANLFGFPGNVTVLAGADVQVSALDFGDSDAAVAVSYTLSEDFWKTENTTLTDSTDIEPMAVARHTYTFRDVRSSINYFFEADGVKSATYRISVVHKPIVTELEAVLTPPSYTGERPDTLEGSGGNIQALEGTKVAIDAATNNLIRNARVKFGATDTLAVEFSHKNLSFDFVALEDGSYSIHLEDDAGHTTDEPLVYSVEVYQDNPPVLDVLEPGSEATLPRNLAVNLGFVASDDYGVAGASVFYRKNGEEQFRRRSIPLEGEKGKREIAKSFTWDLSDMPLFPGNYVEYFVQVQDNNTVTGPGITKSELLHIGVPTMAELYESIKEEETKREDLFEQTTKEGKELQERLEKLNREFKKTEKMDWAQKKEIDKAITSQKNIEEKLDEIQKSMEESLRSLSDNQMTSQEIGEKMEEIKRLIEEINDQALNKYVQELREAMDKLNPDEIKKALENLNLTAEDLLKSLERTENLLKEIQQEQAMEEAVRDAKELMNAQESLQETTEQADSADQGAMEELSKEQNELAEKAKALAAKLQEIAKNSDSQDLAQQMEDSGKQLSESESEGMREAANRLQQQMKQEAVEKQKEVSTDLIALFQRMAMAQMQMQNMSQQRTADNLQKLAKNTLALSFRQEAFSGKLRDFVAAEDPSGVRVLAAEQQTYAGAAEQVAETLHEMSQKSLAVSEVLLQLVGAAIDNMKSTLVFIEQDKAFLSAASASQAVTGLNMATIELLTAATMSSSGGGGGNSSAQMGALQQLLQQQQQILQESQALMQMRATQEQVLQERMAAIERLAGQQRSLREITEQMQKELGGNKRILGRTEKMMQDMDEVIRDLDSGVLDENTIRNEERILSRLLDANRSVNSRDYEKKRTSASADDVFSNPSGTDATTPNSQLLREEIRRAMALKAPGEFEDLIKLYFRALAEEARPAGAQE